MFRFQLKLMILVLIGVLFAPDIVANDGIPDACLIEVVRSSHIALGGQQIAIIRRSERGTVSTRVLQELSQIEDVTWVGDTRLLLSDLEFGLTVLDLNALYGGRASLPNQRRLGQVTALAASPTGEIIVGDSSGFIQYWKEDSTPGNWQSVYYGNASRWWQGNSNPVVGIELMDRHSATELPFRVFHQNGLASEWEGGTFRRYIAATIKKPGWGGWKADLSKLADKVSCSAFAHRDFILALGTMQNEIKFVLGVNFVPMGAPFILSSLPKKLLFSPSDNKLLVLLENGQAEILELKIN